jgi:hypothetical protein
MYVYTCEQMHDHYNIRNSELLRIPASASPEANHGRIRPMYPQCGLTVLFFLRSGSTVLWPLQYYVPRDRCKAIAMWPLATQYFA